jgi:hypothetical protein
MILLYFIFQTVQRCADSWRRIIGSAGISNLLAFFDSQEHLRDSDKARQVFAENYMEQFRFLYDDCSGEDETVCQVRCYPISYVSDNKNDGDFTEMEGDLSRPLDCPDICCAP